MLTGVSSKGKFVLLLPGESVKNLRCDSIIYYFKVINS